jgi:hypothetical protein
MIVPRSSYCDPYQTRWQQFGCFTAMPVHGSSAAVTARQQHYFVPAHSNFSRVYGPLSRITPLVVA